MADLVAYIPLKKNYDSWRVLFDSDVARRKTVCDESRTIVAKVDDKNAMVMMFSVDMQKVRARRRQFENATDINGALPTLQMMEIMSDPEFVKACDAEEIAAEKKIWLAQPLPAPAN